jgi:hypothetical protein
MTTNASSSLARRHAHIGSGSSIAANAQVCAEQLRRETINLGTLPHDSDKENQDSSIPKTTLRR